MPHINVRLVSLLLSLHPEGTPNTLDWKERMTSHSHLSNLNLTFSSHNSFARNMEDFAHYLSQSQSHPRDHISIHSATLPPPASIQPRQRGFPPRRSTRRERRQPAPSAAPSLINSGSTMQGEAALMPSFPCGASGVPGRRGGKHQPDPRQTGDERLQFSTAFLIIPLMVR